ncbi:MAG: ImmA/IrrE family metallo-endopeptidase [Eubacterium sp.]|jgi:Zn-dependent peptidase ImmA (M78 family)|nr:ImmA/IrrE family metallo-endopeptidase [Eubacterium sp.]
MTSIDNNEIFEQYYQTEYDFNTASLTLNEIAEIKRLAREKRVDYASAPMGTGVFNLIQRQSQEIRFELVSFESEKIDGMLYIPTSGQERAYIILNSNKPLVNQVFTAAHEFYHYIKDYQVFKERPYICDFSILKDVNEKKACRFAAELLFPEEALKREINDYCRRLNIKEVKTLDFAQIASFIIIMTVKYQMPLKAVIYRLAEEKYIGNVKEYIENYDFIKKVLQEIKIFDKQVSELYSTDNNFIIPYSMTYQDMEKAFSTGNASKEEILRDAEILSLDMNIVNDFVSREDEVSDDEMDDEELFSIINAKRG